MKAVKLLVLPVLATALIMTGCANRKPAADVQVGQNPNQSGSLPSVNTEGLSEDAALNAQNLAGASAKGVTAANKAFLAKRVVHFNYDSSDLSNEDYQTLQGHAQYLVANANSKVALTGHTDERGTREYNMALGERRAKAVESFLITNGVAATQLEAVSYGKEMPVDAGHDENAWKENRRVELNYEAVPPLLK
ncbi:MAG: peptidoglycan-associated lipoprotein Pal [Acinetobacter harbinensis]|uniref:peptidoglycan-associated lipoprotein Pal n=1 Tax=Acinetobacter TaxID=469 RepID=UPI0005804B36|nr:MULTISPECIES: peptidoglycan-associated lipoprotein Pal [Acinetobacter]KWQ05601.1 peptidoglycan-binding protein [Acinetobacter harbinensis]MBR5556825.1 peptidoglycan-associated lipoprotein Pal [Acinetobacter sp.]MDD2939874.1 peptidoglycan-associated lipoprotein Pal [Acinetobacter harbinensis]